MNTSYVLTVLIVQISFGVFGFSLAIILGMFWGDIADEFGSLFGFADALSRRF